MATLNYLTSITLQRDHVFGNASKASLRCPTNAVEDMPDYFATNWTCMLPFQAHAVAMRQLIEGWQFNGILNAFEGLPFTVTSATNTLNTGATKAQFIGPGNGALPKNQRTMQRWLNTAAFTAPRVPEQRSSISHSSRILCWSPKAIRNLQFRAEYFIITNTPQFNNPTSSIGAAEAGTINFAGASYQLQRLSREIQLGLNECSDRNLVQVFAWIDTRVQDSTNGSSLSLHPSHFLSRRHP